MDRLFAILLMSLLLSGCMKRPQGVDMFVGPECKTSARLIDCDPKFSPPHCKTAIVKYDKNCERIAVGK